MSRRIARLVAMELVFCEMLGGEDTYEAVLQKSDIKEEPSNEDTIFARDILDGIAAHVLEIDPIISELAIGWSIDRMPKVDLAIMRVAMYEMMYLADMPYKVSINEAVELAKTFGGERSPAYINGMLGSLVKRLEGKLDDVQDDK